MIQFIRKNSILKVLVAVLFCFAAFATLSHHHDADHDSHGQSHCVICHAVDSFSTGWVAAGVLLFLLFKSNALPLAVSRPIETEFFSRLHSRAPPALS